MTLKISTLEQINNDLYDQLDKQRMRFKYDQIDKTNNQIESELNNLRKLTQDQAS